MSKLINGQNYFNERSFNEMVKELEKGTAIRIYIDCIGHTRTAMETSNYVEALKEKFGDRLIISKDDWDFEYKLKLYEGECIRCKHKHLDNEYPCTNCIHNAKNHFEQE